MIQFRFIFICLLLLTAIFPAAPLYANAARCLEAAHIAADQTGVPVSVLWAISLTETGRKSGGSVKPWPWTVNMEGKGVWFDTDEEARAYVFKHYKRGARSFDVGCFQINYKWHGQHFASIEEMFEPVPNALYAAKFLTDLYQELGDWSKAAGAYHSRTEKYAQKYRKRFDRFHAQYAEHIPELPRTPTAPPTLTVASQQPEALRENRFPLLLNTAGRGTLGSLVPMQDDRPKPFFTTAQRVIQ